MTTWSRGAYSLSARPTTSSLTPREYMSAVSKKLMPRSMARFRKGRRSPCSSPQGRHADVPKVIVPRQIRETFRPLEPRRTYSILFHADEFDIEEQRRVRRDAGARAARAVAELGRNDERPRAADLHAGDALIPAPNHRAGAELERERLPVIARAVELLAVVIRRLGIVEPSRVMHGHLFAGGSRRPRTDPGVRDLQARDVVHQPLNQSSNLVIG